MPNRILKETVCTSDNVDRLSPEAECFFYRCIVQCDDHGRMDARPAIMRARCFPLRANKITDREISRWLDELVRSEIVYIYEVDGARFVQFSKWAKHQRIRADKSKFPEPPQSPANGEKRGQMPADDSKCPQMLTDSLESREARIEDENREARGTHAASPLPPPVQIFLDNGGQFPKGKLSGGVTKKDKAIEFIVANISEETESLSRWASVVEGYTRQWSGTSYTVMVNDYYLKNRIPGQSNGGDHGTRSGNGKVQRPDRELTEAEAAVEHFRHKS